MNLKGTIHAGSGSFALMATLNKALDVLEPGMETTQINFLRKLKGLIPKGTIPKRKFEKGTKIKTSTWMRMEIYTNRLIVRLNKLCEDFSLPAYFQTRDRIVILFIGNRSVKMRLQKIMRKDRGTSNTRARRIKSLSNIEELPKTIRTGLKNCLNFPAQV